MIVVINNRNRLSWPRAMVEDIRRMGGIPMFLDNDSTYPPLLEWYEDSDDDIPIVFCTQNGGPYTLWQHPRMARGIEGIGPYCMTDPDLDLSRCPDDTLLMLRDTLDRFPHASKVGLSLACEDIPEHYPIRSIVQRIERPYWKQVIGKTPVGLRLPAPLYSAPIDTTFAMYRHPTFSLGPGIRIGGPYTARHLPWYANPLALSPEECYYLDKCDGPRSNVFPLNQ